MSEQNANITCGCHPLVQFPSVASVDGELGLPTVRPGS